MKVSSSKGYVNCLSQFLDGVTNGLHFAVQSCGNVHLIQSEIAKTQGKFLDPLFSNGAMKIGASPRTYSEGFIHGLEIALNAIDTYGTYDSD